jgi:hypothetical protein
MALPKDLPGKTIVFAPQSCRILILELLKQPLQTQVSLSTGELEDFQFQERTHILLPLRDFKVLQFKGDWRADLGGDDTGG